MNNSNFTTVKPQTQVVFMLDLTGELVNEPRTGKRSSDGMFLKKHCKLNAKRRSSEFNEMLAAESYEAA